MQTVRSLNEGFMNQFFYPPFRLPRINISILQDFARLKVIQRVNFLPFFPYFAFSRNNVLCSRILSENLVYLYTV